jgi:hypothetical protein
VALRLAAPIHVVAGWLFIAIWLTTLVHLLAGRNTPGLTGAVLLGILMAMALPRASRHIQILFTLIALATTAVILKSGNPETIVSSLASAAVIAAFLPTLIVIRVAVESSPTIPRIRERVSDMDRSERMAWMTSGAHMLGSILTLGYVSVQRPMLPRELEPDEALRLAECGTRGLGLAVVWSPFFVATAVASQLVPGVPAWQMIAIGLGLAIIGGWVAHVMFNRQLGATGLMQALRRLWPTVPPTLILVGSVAICSSMTGWSGLQSVVLMVPLLCIGFLLWQAPRRIGEALRRIVEGSGRMGDELLIMTGSMVFAGSIAGAQLPDEFRQILMGLVEWPGALIFAEVATIVVLGAIGVHPMITASMLIPATMLLEAPIAAPILAHIVVLAWSLNSTTSAWTLPVVVTSTVFGIPLRALVLGRNIAFIIVFGPLACAALALLNRLLN